MSLFPRVPSNDPMSAVDAFRTAIIKGDIKGIVGAHIEGDVAIFDNIAPFIWRGPSAVADWMSSMTLYVEEHGIRDGSVVYDVPITKFADGDQAYAVIPAAWSYEEKGIPVRDTAIVTFVLRRTPMGWRIAGWSWNASDDRRSGRDASAT